MAVRKFEKNKTVNFGEGNRNNARLVMEVIKETETFQFAEIQHFNNLKFRS